MPFLFGAHISRHDLRLRTGDLSQVAGIRMMTLGEGPEQGVRIADVRTGSGLRFQVTLDRGMDISVAEYRGVPLAYRSPAGDVHPSRFEPRGPGWLRTFAGGLMTGCGMTYLGAPCIDGEAELGLHGRLSHLQASGVAARESWDGDECVLVLEGSLRESTMFGENLLLRRSIETSVGRSRITLRDSVRNEGSVRSPLMMLYHINAGWPLLDAGARLLLSGAKTAPRDPAAAAGLGEARMCTPPVAGFAEQVFYHDCASDGEGFSAALLENRPLALGLLVRQRRKELPRLIQWKMMGEGTYVLGIEPANCGVLGRESERRAGTLEFLDPGEERRFEVQISVVDGEKEIASAISTNRLT
ncbi:MAG TPA: aldose 1-epimerase family protein [Bacteroidota bacterium]|nr:aldose 1-epimerase family protein [Bacteroidota bacterium]